MNRLFSKDYAPEKTEVVTPEKGWKVDVDYDNDYDPFNDNERVGKIEAYSRDFCRQDGGLSRDEALELSDGKDGNIVLPLYLYSHSGERISTKPFGIKWDSGCIGIVHCTLTDAARFGIETAEEAKKAMAAEIEYIGRYLAECAYEVTIFHDGVEVVSAGGLIGCDEVNTFIKDSGVPEDIKFMGI